MPPDTLDQPLLPPLRWNEYCWVGEVVLPSWAGFQVRRCRRGGATKSAHGTARLTIIPVDSQTRTPPTMEQVAAFLYLVENEAAMGDAVARALVEYCPGDAYDGDDDELLNASEPDDLHPLVGLSAVHILDVSRDGAACMGFEFECAWDEEHGAGVMTHLGQVIATGQADCSFVTWIARQGLDRQQGHH